jgi:hypothetical protein
MNSKDLTKVLNANYSFSIDINGVSVSTQWGIYHNHILPQETYKLVLLAITRNANHRIINVKAVEPLANAVKQDPRSVKSVLKGLTTFKSKNLYMSQFLFVDNQLSI